MQFTHSFSKALVLLYEKKLSRRQIYPAKQKIFPHTDKQLSNKLFSQLITCVWGLYVILKLMRIWKKSLNKSCLKLDFLLKVRKLISLSLIGVKLIMQSTDILLMVEKYFKVLSGWNSLLVENRITWIWEEIFHTKIILKASETSLRLDKYVVIWCTYYM